MSKLSSEEFEFLKKELKREPNDLEMEVIQAEWSEHCSYKSSKKYIRLLPSRGKRVVLGPGYDAAALDIGDGYAITIHIESHNHPSAIEPYGGAATGVGGVIRDIMSMGTRPIALFDALRFGPIDRSGKENSKSKWIFKNVVRGIADYSNCIGIPTVAGEVEFDSSFKDYCLVDVASIGISQINRIVSNHASKDDYIIVAGNGTGRDGIGGSSFASKRIDEENRSAVQIPDPFLEKLLLEATMEAVEKGCVKALKDLGGGGLSCCLSEMSDSLRRGFDIELSNIHAKGNNLTAAELMVSESQERMLFITDSSKFRKLKAIFDKYDIKYSLIGRVKNHKDLVLRFHGKVVARMPSSLISHAPILERKGRQPNYVYKLQKLLELPPIPQELNGVLLSMLANPSIANKSWIYEQYDYEVGTKTVLKPGFSDAAVLRVTDNRFLSVKLDGNSKHCYLDPYQGTLGCLSESFRNITCTGADPIAVIDHLQFGSPEDANVYWCFKRSVKALIDYCEFMHTPVVGGKVSFYNETSNGVIKPSPVIGCIGLIEDPKWITRSALKPGNSIFIVGSTLDEMGGSEYYEHYHNFIGGPVPRLNFKVDRLNRLAMLTLIKKNLVESAHDCSKGGLVVALSEMALQGLVGLKVSLDLVPNSCRRVDNLLFSESQSRYIFGTNEAEKVEQTLTNMDGLVYAKIGNSSSKESGITFTKNDLPIIGTSMECLQKRYSSLEKIML
ncbi:MAG TPA: phosphoribosylformylglycinamidine synthase subunit PurL [Nitrososphaeraceae archaeon]